MAYNGSTAGSTAANPPILMASALGGKILNNGSTINGTGGGAGGQLWFYSSTDSSTAPFTANYFTDAFYIGMKGGDVVEEGEAEALFSAPQQPYTRELLAAAHLA